MAIEYYSQKLPLRKANATFIKSCTASKSQKMICSDILYLLSLCAHSIANHTGPVGGSWRRQGRRLPSDLQDPRSLTTLDLHLLGRERGPWGAQHTHWIRREKKTAQQQLNHFRQFDKKLMCWPQYYGFLTYSNHFTVVRNKDILIVGEMCHMPQSEAPHCIQPNIVLLPKTEWKENMMWTKF